MEGIISPPSDFRSASFLKPLVISVIGIISTIVAILLYHYILVNYCSRRQQLTDTTNNLSQPVQGRPLPSGVDKKILETIPIISYATEEGHLVGVDQTECVVCLGELKHGEIVRLLPTCKHAFHVTCIDKWFVAHNSCPICRSPMVALVNNDPAAPPLPPCVEESRRELQPPPDQEREHGVNVNAASSSGQQSCSLLRHCASLVLLPVDQRQSRRRLIIGLKRSLSMDQYSAIIDIESETRDRDCSSSSHQDDSVTRRLYRARSVKHLDRVSANLLRSFSRLRMGRNSTEILPY